MFRCGDYHLDAVNRRFTCRGSALALEPKTFAVLLQLVSRPGALVTRNELLDAVWGHRYVTPSTLNRVIALARRAFGDGTDEPQYIETVHGAGYRYIGPMERDAAEESDKPVRFGPPQAARLPARVTPLIGRELELAALTELMSLHRAVTVLGTGGMGKTQCALEWARRSAAQFADGVWFFDLAPMRSGTEWLSALAAVLTIPSLSPAESLAAILPVLQGRRALLLLDNCDRIAAEVGALVFELLRATDELKVLATSQAPLSFLGEQVTRMPPLTLPPPGSDETVSARELGGVAAVEMLVARITAVQPAFILSDANAAPIAEICRRLDGMPLALELAAARFALLSADQVVRRLTDRFRFLSSNAAGRDPRHRNLVVLLDWSVSLLSAEEQRLLSWLSVFVRGWTVEAAIALAPALRSDPEAIVELLAGLVEKSLVSMDASYDPPRYRLLETVRDYAGERLRASNEQVQADDAHLSCLVQMSRLAHDDMVGGHMRHRVAQLMPDEGNIARALDYALEKKGGRESAALAILGLLTLYVKARGVYYIAQRWGRDLLEQCEAQPTLERARALLCQGVVTVHMGTHTNSAEASLLEAIRLARLHEDSWTEAYASGYCALWLANCGRSAAAPPFADATLRIASERNDPLLLGLAGLARGWIHIAGGNYREAIDVMRAARDLGDDPHQRHFLDMYIGLALFRLADDAAAAAQWLEAMHGAANVGNIRGVAGSVEGCGYIAERLGQPAVAARLLTVAARVRERTGVPLFTFWLVHHEAAAQRLRSTLGAVEYAAAVAAGKSMREEDAANEVRARLQDYSRRASATAQTNTPSGS